MYRIIIQRCLHWDKELIIRDTYTTLFNGVSDLYYTAHTHSYVVRDYNRVTIAAIKVWNVLLSSLIDQSDSVQVNNRFCTGVSEVSALSRLHTLVNIYFYFRG